MPMKVLHISHSREQSGVGEAIRNYQRAMQSVGLDIVSRPILLNNSGYRLESDLAALEAKNDKNCNVVIQHILPRYMSYNGNFKNVGFFVLESKNINRSPWINNLNLMDELWTPNSDTIDTRNGIKIPQKLVPHTCNINLYKKEYGRLPGIENTFNFYWIGEFSRRKNLSALLTAFHLEFRHEPVNLILKCNKPGLNSERLFHEIKNFCDKIKEGLKLKPEHCKSEIIITDYLSKDDLMKLHKSCDCYINASRGEAWEQSCFDAMGMGNLVISSNDGGPKDYLSDYHSYLIDGVYEPVFAAGPETVPEIYTGYENWFNIDINILRSAMRDAYEGGSNRQEQKECGLSIAEKYSYKNIGNLIKQILEEKC